MSKHTASASSVKWPTAALEQLALAEPMNIAQGRIIAKNWPLSALAPIAEENVGIFNRIDVIHGDLIVTDFVQSTKLHQFATLFFQRTATRYDHSRFYATEKISGGTAQSVESDDSEMGLDFYIRNNSSRGLYRNSNIVGEIAYSTSLAGAVERATLALTEFPDILLFIIVYIKHPWPTNTEGAYITDSNRMLLLTYPRPQPGGPVVPSQAVAFGDMSFVELDLEFICSTAHVHHPDSPQQAQYPVWAGVGIGTHPACDEEHRELPALNVRIPGAVLLDAEEDVDIADANFDLVLPLFELKSLIKSGIVGMERRRQQRLAVAATAANS